jgi:hypothetical protein
MSSSAGEAYTHLLIPVSKTKSATIQEVCAFLEQMIQMGSIGKEHKVGFSKVARVEQRVQEVRNPFNGQLLRRKNPSRKGQRPEDVAALSDVVLRVEQEQDYNVFVSSTSRPANPPLEVGFAEMNKDWQPWSGPDYYLGIRCCVRSSLVGICPPGSVENPEDPRPEVPVPIFDDECGEELPDGCFVHPQRQRVIRIPKVGCGRFWVEFEFGKWVYPRLESDGAPPLNHSVTELARHTFGTEFIEGCLWM